MNIHQTITNRSRERKKMFAVLIDPDKCQPEHLEMILKESNRADVDFFLLGGSLLLQDHLTGILHKIKKESHIPSILFPGNTLQVNDHADALLLLSLISGRNPELLIGKHVIAAPFLKRSNLEVLSTGYLLVDGGITTTVHYISQTMPIPADKDEIAACTAMAGELLGMKLIYLDAGSGAVNPVPPSMITAVKQSIAVPLIIGGGITSAESARIAFKSGADMVVAGNAIEKNPLLIGEIASARYL